MYVFKLEFGKVNQNGVKENNQRRYLTNSRLQLLGFLIVIVLGILSLVTNTSNDPTMVIVLVWSINFISGLHK